MLSNRKKMLDKLSDFISLETNLLHLNGLDKPYLKGDLIPIALNFTYCLALFRTKERKQVEKALFELEHLLSFQGKEGETTGNFPTFLHQYPFCERYLEVLEILFPLYWIAKEFHTLLNTSLKEKLYRSLKIGMEFMQPKEPREYSYILTLQRAILTFAIASLLEDEKWIKVGNLEIERLLERGPQTSWGSPRALSKILMALSLLSKEEMYLQWNFFWIYLYKTWDFEKKVYLGPALFEHFEKDDEERTLYHLAFEQQQEKLSLPSISPITLLQGELIKEGLLKKIALIDEQNNQAPNYLGPYQWENNKQPNFSLSFFNLKKDLWVKTGGFYPLKIVFQNEGQVDSLVLQMGNYVKIKLLNTNQIQLTFEPKEEELLDIAFFWNLSSKATLQINDKKASMFRMDQEVKLKFKEQTIQFLFPDPSDFIWGQLMQKSRRSQIYQNQAETYDAHLYFREIKPIKKPVQMILCID